MAVRYHFTSDFDHSPRYGVTIAYKAWTEQIIPGAHALAADKAKAGVRLVRAAKAGAPIAPAVTE